jgi:hypothetical protein
LGIKVPKLDDVNFAQLVEEAIKRIPQYTSDWTDFNLHDPGITLIELLAWLVEMQIFHLDQITEKHYEKFLKLLGVERQPTETIEDAIMRFRKDLKKSYRAVTFADFEHLTKEMKKVARAKAVWNSDEVEVIIVPEEKVVPTEELKKEVCLNLDKYRLLTTPIKVIYPEYVLVSVKAIIKIKPLASAVDVKKKVTEMLEKFFDPRQGYDGSGWPFGRSVYTSEVYAKIENVEGVDCVQNLALSAVGNANIKNDNVEVKKNALIYSGVHTIQIAEDQVACKGVQY